MGDTRKNNEKSTIFKTMFYSKHMSILVGLLCVIITFVLWNTTRTNDLHELSQNVDTASEIYYNRVQNRIQNMEFDLSELAGHGHPTTSEEERAWDTRTDFYLENLVGVKNIVLVDKDLLIQRVNPMESDDYIVGNPLGLETESQRSTNLIIPTYSDDILSGFIVCEVDVTELILKIGFESDKEYMIQVFDDNELLASSDNWIETNNIQHTVSKDVLFKNTMLKFTLTPTDATISDSTSDARVILFFGLILSVVISYIWYSRTAISDRLEDLVSKKTTELSHMSYHDQLTGLYNRRYYETKIIEYEQNQVFPFSIILADINGLKLVNDAFGHQEGDDLLKLASNLMSVHIPKDATICRIGGDEFVILLPKCDVKDAEVIISNIEKHSSDIKKENIQLSISFGVASRKKGDSLVELFRVAEDRMYQSKLIEVPSMRSNAINTIMQTLNEKDNYSEQHVRNVAELAKRLAEFIHLPVSDIKEIHTAGLLHDIGKIIIPTTILNKEGKLDDEEYAVMKSHPEIGFRILNSTAEMRSISKVVLHHHERIDGKGYPQQLRGEEIPLKSRIISVADAYDAMTTYRTYQRTLTKEEALSELQRCSGTQFDATIVTVFSEHIEEITLDM